MQKDPIQELKEELQKILPLFDQLRTEINSSQKSVASAKLQEIEHGLHNIRMKIKNDFQWLLPQEPIIQKKYSLFGLKK